MAQQERLLNKRYVSLFMINLIVSISFSMISTTVSLYVKGFGVTAATVGTVVGALSIASLCMRPFTGIISDRIENRSLLMGALGLIALALLGSSFTGSVPLLIAFRILHGIGFSVATTVTLVLAAGTIPEKSMTQGMGYFALGQTIATAGAPSIGLWLGGKYGFAVTFRCAACTLMLAIILTFVFVEERKPKYYGTGKGFQIKLSDMFSVSALPFCVLSAVTAGATGLENGYVSLFGNEIGLTNAGWYFTIAAAALFVSRLFGGKLTDRYEHIMIPAGFLLMSAGFLALGVLTNTPSVGILTIVFAFTAAFKSLGLGIVQPALQASCMRCVESDRRGAASGTYYLGTDIGQAFAPMLGGVVMERAGSRVMFGVYSIPLVLAIVLYFMTQKRKRG